MQRLKAEPTMQPPTLRREAFTPRAPPLSRQGPAAVGMQRMTAEHTMQPPTLRREAFTPMTPLSRQGPAAVGMQRMTADAPVGRVASSRAYGASGYGASGMAPSRGMSPQLSATRLTGSSGMSRLTSSARTRVY